MENQSFFATETAIQNFQHELDKGSAINMIIGPKVYEEISSPWINERYKKLIDNGLLLAFNPDAKDAGCQMRDGRYVISCRLAEDGEKRKPEAINELYSEFLPIFDLSKSLEEIEKEYYNRKNHDLLTKTHNDISCTTSE